jgi:hypothetical protein
MTLLTRPRDSLVKSTNRPANRAKTALVATTTNPDLIAIVALCAIVLLTMINVILRFPDLGALIERYNQF